MFDGSEETGQLGGRGWTWISFFACLVGFFLLLLLLLLLKEDLWMEIGIFVLEEEDFFALLLFPFAMLMKLQSKWDG